MNGIVITLSLVLAISVLGCSSGRQTQQTSVKETITRGAAIPPNHCRIVGTIVGVDSVLDRSDTTSPCSRFPCRATVRIDSVLGYGMAFPQPLAVGTTVEAAFLFTLHSTAGLFPGMAETFPGLKVGDVFRADLRGLESDFPGGRSPVSYSIARYELLSPRQH